ncbi:LutB/LldF family L-lactate oxidation iron-sulfur protein [Aestuariispira insulae]|uniref:L-lactate dehydrogenase complex protein LldF n=1 Tax=Aestuariispira insulae TaxID=1461337 RepID=A0A3D9HR57_9PROT|nr:LutB/LldF family L-lactate oxidation iron-sulfur protein [Aestuariispira insulae]RED51376.1 L-lactate dehydrogenase complex protein LldF [Aestuariispira insulae]
MEPKSRNFEENAHQAMKNPQLQTALAKMKVGFVERRAAAADRLPEFDALRDQARDIKNHVLDNIDFYLERFEEKVTEQGGQVHWARNATEACDIIGDICKSVNAKMVTKGKSMVAEEIALNAALEKQGLEVVETDLGEYIIQLRKEAPSHIIAPAIHVLKEQVAENFRDKHEGLDPDRVLDEPTQLIHEAREVLRQKYIDSDVGITGANFLIAETGTSVIVTNEGNGDLTQTLPKVHVVIASLEKVVPTLEDASAILRVLARSATGQEFSAYTTFSSGPKRAEDPDGPEEYHVVLLDNGRSSMLGTEFQEMLRCIRCGACMNHCPVYGAVGGHAYGWVYPGPMGSVLTPSFIGVEEGGKLPNASTFCGRCEQVCPMRIPLPKMMRHYRAQEFEKGYASRTSRWALKAWAFLARRPGLYQALTGIGIRILGDIGRRRGTFSKLPLASGWTDHRDMPVPRGRTFQQLWAEKNGRRSPGKRLENSEKEGSGQ